MKKLLAIVLLVGASFSANADLNGASVTGTLAFGANGGNGGQYWVPQNSTIGAGLEFSYHDGANTDTVDFTGTTMTIVDDVLSNANGWKMTFNTPGGFSNLSLISSDFAPGLTFSLTGGQIEVDWLGTMGPAVPYTATFNIAAVPEPETYAMMMAGLGLLGAMARRRNSKQQ